jgi:uncharacterized protein YndB with AHSA1/START domain
MTTSKITSEKIGVEAIVSADTKKVWDLYTNPEHITKWNAATPEWHCPKAENDLRVGGKYSARMEAKDGSVGFDFEAVYDEVVAGESFTYTLTDGRKVATTFKNLDGKTKVVITFDAESEHSADMQRAGWQAILDNFKHYAQNQ